METESIPASDLVARLGIFIIDPAITTAHGLEMPRLAMGWRHAGAVRAAVELASANRPRWAFLDSTLDLDAIGRSDTRIETGGRSTYGPSAGSRHQ